MRTSPSPTSQPNSEAPLSHNNVNIWQQNVNKSLTCQLALIETVRTRNFDFVPLQEPYLDHNHSTRTPSSWRTVYPELHWKQPAKTRSVILVNNAVDTNSWSAVDAHCSDITAINIKTLDTELLLINAYNDCTHNQTLTALRTFLRKQLSHGRLRKSVILLGDFNRHHPQWESLQNSHLCTHQQILDAQDLIDITDEFHLTMTLAPKTPTLRAFSTGNYTRVDNIFMSSSITNLVSTCKTAPADQPVKTDHFPIITTINTTPCRSTPQTLLNFKTVDWEKFNNKLSTLLKHTPPLRVN